MLTHQSHISKVFKRYCHSPTRPVKSVLSLRDALISEKNGIIWEFFPLGLPPPDFTSICWPFFSLFGWLDRQTEKTMEWEWVDPSPPPPACFRKNSHNVPFFKSESVPLIVGDSVTQSVMRRKTCQDSEFEDVMIFEGEKYFRHVTPVRGQTLHS